MALPLSDRPSRQCTVILADDDLEKLDALCAPPLGEARSSMMRAFFQMGVDLMTDPVNSLPTLIDGIVANMQAFADHKADDQVPSAHRDPEY